MKSKLTLVLAVILSSFSIVTAQIPGLGDRCFTAMCLHEQLGVPQNNQWRTSNPPNPTPPTTIGCGDMQANNNLFYIFCASDADVGLGLEFSNCGSTTMGLIGGLEMVLYEVDRAAFDPMNPDCNSFLTEIDCISTNGLPVPMNQIGFRNNLTPGNYYMLVVDGYMFDYCDFTIQGSGISDLSATPMEPTFDPPLPTAICVGDEFEINVAQPEDCIEYRFQSLSLGGSMSLDWTSPNSFATATGVAPGLVEICVLASSACNSEEYCYEVEILPIPRLDPIFDYYVCEPEVDFCDYNSFFDPGLSPDPDANGWDVTFHLNRSEAEDGTGALACPYDMSTSGLEIFYIRTEIMGLCYSIAQFRVIYAKPRFAEIELDDFCGPITLDLSLYVIPKDVFSTTYSKVGFYAEEGDALVDAGELSPPEVTESGTYWIRVESDTDPKCVTVEPFEVNIVNVPEIEVELVEPICALDTFAIDLSELELTELTGDFNLDDLIIRYYDYEPDIFTLNTPLVPPVVKKPGTYWVTVLIPIESSTQQFCISDPVPIVIDTVGPPLITLDHVPPRCLEDLTQIIFNINSPTDMSIDWELSNGDGGTIFASGSVESTSVTIDPFTDTIWVKITDAALTDGGQCQPVWGDSIFILPPPKLELTIAQDTSVCRGDTARLFFYYTGTEQLEVEYTDGTDFYTVQNIGDKSFVEVFVDTETTFWLENAVADSGCEIALLDSATISLYEIPDYTITRIECLPSKEYVVEIEFTGGVSGTYTLDGNPVGDTYTSPPIPSGMQYEYELDDINACGPVEIIGTFNCSCTGQAGTMSPQLLELCIDDTAFGTHNADSITEAGDVFYFVLHTSSTTMLGTLLDSSATPDFNFDPAYMTIGTTYYISAVTGDDDGSGAASRMDSCFQASQGQPVVFYDLSDAQFPIDLQACEGDVVSIRIEFLGRAPFRFVLDSAGVLTDTLYSSGSDTTLSILVNENHTWRIPWMSDALGCANGNVADEIDITLYPELMRSHSVMCSADNTTYTVTIDLSGGTMPYFVNSNQIAGSQFISNPIPSGDPVTFTFEDANGCTAEDLFLEIDCNCTTNSGSIQNASPVLCLGDMFSPVVDIAPTLDGNDVSTYMIYSDLSDPEGSFIGFFNATIGFMPASMTFGQSYYIAPVTGNDDGSGGVDFSDDCLSIGQSITVVWNDKPQFSLTVPDSICLSDDIDLDFVFNNGAPDFTIDYMFDGVMGQWTANSLNYTETISNTSPGDYTISISRVTDASSCVLDTNLMYDVHVRDTFSVSNILAVCEADNANYRVSFTIQGGSGRYLIGGTNVQAGAYVSDLISSSSPNYSITISDLDGCHDFTIDGSINCDCPNPGLMSSDTLSSCGDGVLSYTTLTDPMVSLQFGDVEEYILHDNGGTTRGTVLDRNVSGQFNFIVASMTYGQVYYISRVVGDDDGTGSVDFNDPCSQVVAQGQPAIWYEEPTSVIDGPDLIVLTCQVKDATLSGTNSTPIGQVSYRWILENGATTTSASINQSSLIANSAGTYILEASTGNGKCVAYDTVMVTSDGNLPTANIVEPEIINCLRDSVLLSSSGSSQGPNIELIWVRPNGSQITGNLASIFANAPGQYELIVRDNQNDCEARYQVTVLSDFSVPVVDAGLGGAFNCDVDSLPLMATVSYPSGSGSINWTLDNNPIPLNSTSGIATTPGTYTINATDDVSGCTTSDIVIFGRDTAAVYNALIDAISPICFGDQNGEIMVTEVFGGPRPYQFSINGGTLVSQPDFTSLPAGSYDLEIFDANGCRYVTTIVLNNPPNLQVEMQGDTIISQGETIQLRPRITGDAGGGEESIIDTIFISFVDILNCTSCPNPQVDVSPIEGTNYEITIITENGCVIKDSRFINVRIDRPFFVPTAMSPNGDGINDKFTLHFGKLDQIEKVSDFVLYDRWGNLLASAKTLQPADRIELWNGFFNGQRLNPQVLVWSVTVEYKDGWFEVYSGDIALIH